MKKERHMYNQMKWYLLILSDESETQCPICGLVYGEDYMYVDMSWWLQHMVQSQVHESTICTNALVDKCE